MTEEEGLQPGTAKDMEGVDWDGLKKMGDDWQKEEAKLRKLYLERPDRKQFFEYDFVEALWFHMLEYYGKAVSEEEIEEMIYTIHDDNRLWEMVYDAVEKLAERKGWEMTI